jgi:hypothetical protein
MRPSGLTTSGAQWHQMSARQDILVSRYVSRTLVHDTTMIGSSTEGSLQGTTASTVCTTSSRSLGLSAEQSQDIRLVGQQLLFWGQEYWTEVGDGHMESHHTSNIVSVERG